MPPGFITMFEVFSLKKPVLYLPPKNAGQHKIFQEFKKYGIVDFSINWEDIYPELLSYRNSWDIMKRAEYYMQQDKKLPSILYTKIVWYLK